MLKKNSYSTFTFAKNACKIIANIIFKENNSSNLNINVENRSVSVCGYVGPI